MAEEAVRIEVDEEVTLAGGWRLPAAPKGAAVVLHPHPLYGGSMDNNVVEALMRAAERAGLAALRFNFRGVGRSTGRHADGMGEVADVLAAAAWVRARAPEPLVLMGYSFGTLVGARAAGGIANLAGGVWVSPPLVLGELPSWPAEAGPLYMTVGTADQFTDLPKLKAYAGQMGTRVTLKVAEGGDHFWWDDESVLTRDILEFVHKLVSPGI